MKKLLLVLWGILVLSANAKADVCYDVNKEVMDNAVKIINRQKVLYEYCSICSDAESKVIEVKNVQKQSPVSVNGIKLDLAHTYYKNKDKFINLGIAAGCIHADEYYIKAQLDDLPVIHNTPEKLMQQAKMQTQETFEQCFAKYKTTENATTADMIKQNTAVNNCLAAAIEHEIEQGFDLTQQKEMLLYLKQLRKSTSDFYRGLHLTNKYCERACGTMFTLFPYNDEGKMLMEILERLIYLNITKLKY